jgi:electron transfer flavoprotein alpha subunit
MWDELLTPIEEAAEAMHVWVVAEVEQGEISPVSFELLGAARDLADLLGVRVEAVLLGKGVGELAEQLGWRGADMVYVIEDERLAEYRTEEYAGVLGGLIEERNPEIVLLGATDIGEDLGPRLAQRLDTGLLCNCTKVEVDQAERLLLGTRPTYAGELMITSTCTNKHPQMATVRPGAIDPYPPDQSRLAEIEQVAPEWGAESPGARSVGAVEELPRASLQDARIVVAGGRGVGAEGFELVEKLARRLGASVGASRGALDEGWVEKEYWVGGAGGTPVAPDLYVACGISGALQHYMGIKDAKFIVAINTDPEAAIFKFADVGIVGDVHEVVPALLAGLGADKG